jgi:hypothetical protein
MYDLNCPACDFQRERVPLDEAVPLADQHEVEHGNEHLVELEWAFDEEPGVARDETQHRPDVEEQPVESS